MWRAGRGISITAATLLLATTLVSAFDIGSPFDPPDARAAGFVVNSQVDEVDAIPGDGVCLSTPSGVCTLRAAVMEVNALGGSHGINLPAGFYRLTITGSDEDGAATGDLDVTAAVTITGAGAANSVINGNGTDRVLDLFNASDAQKELRDLTVENGVSTGRGGGIRSQSPLTLTRVRVSANASSSNDGGGGISHSSVLTVTGSTISGNTASAGDGGGINGVSTTLTDTTISGNSARSGGGFFGDLTATRTVISGNTATFGGGGGGGALISQHSSFTESSITGNTSSGNGGGIRLVSGSSPSLSIIRSSVTGNTAPGRKGGGIHAFEGTLTVDRSTLSSNEAYDGGAVYVDDQGSGVTLSMTNSTISTNTATHLGGGIYFAEPARLASLTNMTITANAAETGGAIRKIAGTMQLRNVIVANSPSGGECGLVTPLQSLGHNLDSGTSCGFASQGDLPATNPLLGLFADNGGPTKTHVLLAGSPAIDAGDSAGCPVTDQRGIARPQGAACDIGAYEVATPAATATPMPTATRTSTVTPGGCQPRPPVSLQTSRPSFGMVSVAVAAGLLPSKPSNWLRRIRFERLDNAAVDVRGLTNQRQPFTVELPERPRQVELSVTWVTQGPFMAHLVVEDDCGEWRTFVGAGAGAF